MSRSQNARIMKFIITGMTCGHCISAVTNAIKSVAGVTDALVELPSSASVTWKSAPEPIQIEQLQAFVKAAGYSAAPEDQKDFMIEKPSSPAQSFPKLTLLTLDTTTNTSLPKLPMISDSEPSISYSGLNLLQTDLSVSTTNQKLPTLESWELSVTGMHCASCVGRVENALLKTQGVKQAMVNLATEQATVLIDPEAAQLDQLRLNVRNAGYDMIKKDSSLSAADQADALRRERNERVQGWRNRLLAGCILGLPLLLFAHGSHTRSHMQPFMKWMLVALSAITTSLVGLPYFRSAWTLLKFRSSNMDTLVSLGSLVAFGYGTWMTIVPDHPQPHFLADGVIILIMITFGKWLEARSKGSAADALEGLMDLAPRRVTAVRASGREIVIDQEDLRIGMLFRVKPGEAIATDGEVVDGSANVDESMLTGESFPSVKTQNSKVIGGTRNLDGTLLIRATQVGVETVLSNIINAVKRAQSTKSAVQSRVDRIAAVFVPIVIGISILTLLVWGLVLNRWAEGVLASAAVLLISCPCALGLATPMAVAVASKRAAGMGLIIRDAGVFDRCDKLNYCMFDKTGTLTEGKPVVLKTWNATDLDQKNWLSWAATLESYSEHPLASAISKMANHDYKSDFTDILNDRGNGISGKIGGNLIQVGSVKWLIRNGVQIDRPAEQTMTEWSNQALSIVGVANNDKLNGLIALEDSIRPGAADVMNGLSLMKIQVGIISGDLKSAAQGLAEKLNIRAENVYAEISPEGKSQLLDELRSNGSHVAMVGDGLNDAPALASADVSMALASGTDVAKNAADIVIVGSNLNSVVDAIALSRATLRTIRDNLFWAFSYNVVAIPMAAFGVFRANGPLIASVAMAGSSITVVLRSAWLSRTNLKNMNVIN